MWASYPASRRAIKWIWRPFTSSDRYLSVLWSKCHFYRFRKKRIPTVSGVMISTQIWFHSDMIALPCVISMHSFRLPPPQSYCNDPDLVLELKNLIVIFADTLQVFHTSHSHAERFPSVCTSHADILDMYTRFLVSTVLFHLRFWHLGCFCVLTRAMASQWTDSSTCCLKLEISTMKPCWRSGQWCSGNTLVHCVGMLHHE